MIVWSYIICSLQIEVFLLIKYRQYNLTYKLVAQITKIYKL